MVWAHTYICHKSFVFGVCYRPPNDSASFVADLHDAIDAITSRHPNAFIFLLGDFNFPNISWSSDPPVSKPFSSESFSFINLCSVFSLHQIVSQPTRLANNAANTLDLVLTNCPDMVSDLSYLPGLSDHLALSFELKYCQPPKHQVKKSLRNYNKGNFEAINNELSSFLDVFLEGFESRTTESNWNMFASKVHELIDRHVPMRTICSHSKAPWYTSYIKRLCNRKKRFFRSAKHSPSEKRWDAYKK